MASENEQLAKNLKSAPVWVLFDQVFGRILRIGVSIILARILIPDDFGVYAISLGLLELARLTGNLGIGTSIIQSNEDPHHFANSAFWVNMGASLFMLASSFVFGLVGAHFYGMSVYKLTVPILGLTFLSAGYIHINQSLIIRNMRFKVITQASVLRVIAEGVSSVVLAILGFGYWAFILGFVIGDFINSLVIYFLSEWRHDWRPDFRYPRKYLKFGAGIFLFSASIYLLEQLPNLIIGKITSIYVLGVFSFAMRQSRWIADVPKMAGKNFLLSALSRVQDIQMEFEKYYALWIKFLLVWGMPLFAVQIALAPWYVPVVFDEKWVPAIQALQILVLFMFLDVSFYEVHTEAIVAKAKVRLNVYWRIIEGIFIAIALFITASKGVTAIAAAMLIVRIILLPIFMFSTSYKLPIKLGKMMKQQALLMILALLFCGLNFYLSYLIFQTKSTYAIFFYGLILTFWCIGGFYLAPETRKLLDILFVKFKTPRVQLNQS